MPLLSAPVVWNVRIDAGRHSEDQAELAAGLSCLSAAAVGVAWREVLVAGGSAGTKVVKVVEVVEAAKVAKVAKVAKIAKIAKVV